MSVPEEDIGDAALKQAENTVEKLFYFRDHFVEINGVEKAADKNIEVETNLKEALYTLDQLQLTIDNKAAFFSLRGQALNVTPDYDPKAVACLSKAVKLDPSLIDAWNHLGECYWKNKEIDAAKNCFTGALAKSRKKTTLRNLSMVLRQMGKDAQERFMNVTQSVEIAKEAVAQDVTDGMSWFVLGNAYLSLFFCSCQNLTALKQAMAAYSRAEKDSVAASNPDLHFNRAMMHKYREEYQLALDGFEKAGKLDPDWNDPFSERQKLIRFLENVSCNIEKKGKLKPKKLASLSQSIKDSDLGPYSGGQYTSPSGKTIKLQTIKCSELENEVNSGKVIVGKIAVIIPFVDPLPYPFLMVDQNGDCIAVTVYNVAAGKGFNIGDSVAIPEPFLQQTTSVALDKDKNISFKSIRVDNPVVMVINKRKVGTDKLAFSVLAVTNKSG